MRFRTWITTAYLPLTFIIAVPARATADTMFLKQIKPQTITLFGEKHKSAETIVWFQHLIGQVLERHSCVIIGLEIASDQQTLLDAAARGGSLQQLQLWPAIDHSAYRDMVAKFAHDQQQGNCIQLIAIDSAADNPVPRDEWMAEMLAGHLGSAPVIALLGSLHTLKRVNWKTRHHSTFVAGLLHSQDIDLHTYPIIAPEQKCEDRPKTTYLAGDAKEALQLLNHRLASLMNADEYESTSDVIDGFVVLSCPPKP